LISFLKSWKSSDTLSIAIMKYSLIILLASLFLFSACDYAKNPALDTSKVDDRLERAKSLGNAAMVNDIVSESKKAQQGEETVKNIDIYDESLPLQTERKEEEAMNTIPSSVDSLQIQEQVIGKGEEAAAGKTVTVHYTGMLTNRKVFDSSVSRGQPFVFSLGSGQVIPGWDYGIEGMRVGGKRRLLIPPDLAYGQQGVVGAIPPNATLVFDVELLKVE
jgi:FKBP-type peptidyl-prolyl cis-trans isomerase